MDRAVSQGQCFHLILAGLVYCVASFPRHRIRWSRRIWSTEGLLVITGVAFVERSCWRRRAGSPRTICIGSVIPMMHEVAQRLAGVRNLTVSVVRACCVNTPQAPRHCAHRGLWGSICAVARGDCVIEPSVTITELAY